jgi:hypothetical protein
MILLPLNRCGMPHAREKGGRVVDTFAILEQAVLGHRHLFQSDGHHVEQLRHEDGNRALCLFAQSVAKCAYPFEISKSATTSMRGIL